LIFIFFAGILIVILNYLVEIVDHLDWQEWILFLQWN
jgi:hypothetical protein